MGRTLLESRKERLFGASGHGCSEPDEELDVLVVRNGRKAQEDRGGLKSLRRTPLPIGPEHGRHRFRLEEDLRREEVAAGLRLLDEPVDLRLPLGDRDVAERHIASLPRHLAEKPIRFRDRRARVADPPARPADEHEVPEPMVGDRLPNPSTQRGAGHVRDDFVRDRLHAEIVAESRDEVAWIQIAVERLPGVVLVQHFGHVHAVEVRQRARGIANPLHEGRDRLLARATGGRDDLEDDRRGVKPFAERRHARRDGVFVLLETFALRRAGTSIM